MKKSVFWMIMGISCNLISVSFLYLTLKMNWYPDLRLKCEKIEVKRGENVDAGMYILSCSSDNGRVILPEIQSEKCGNYAAVYSLIQDNDRIERILLIEVTE